MTDEKRIYPTLRRPENPTWTVWTLIGWACVVGFLLLCWKCPHVLWHPKNRSELVYVAMFSICGFGTACIIFKYTPRARTKSEPPTRLSERLLRWITFPTAVVLICLSPIYFFAARARCGSRIYHPPYDIQNGEWPKYLLLSLAVIAIVIISPKIGQRLRANRKKARHNMWRIKRRR